MYIIYRYYSGENLKGRPPYYSKRLALASFVRAVRHTPGVRVIFLHDGPVPEDVRKVMASTGELLPISAGSNRQSYLRAIQLPRQLGWDPESFAFLCEDDYLYLPDALTRLQAAVDTYRDVDYFTPYTIYRLDEPAELGVLDGLAWERILSTTSTFGGRVRVLLEDERLLGLCPFSGGAWDYATCLAFQGKPAFAWTELWRDVSFRGEEATGLFRARLAARAVSRAVVNLRSHRRRARQRVLAAPNPNIATHLETEYLAPNQDWLAIGTETAAWALAEGLPLDLSIPLTIAS